MNTDLRKIFSCIASTVFLAVIALLFAYMHRDEVSFGLVVDMILFLPFCAAIWLGAFDERSNAGRIVLSSAITLLCIRIIANSGFWKYKSPQGFCLAILFFALAAISFIKTFKPNLKLESYFLVILTAIVLLLAETGYYYLPITLFIVTALFQMRMIKNNCNEENAQNRWANNIMITVFMLVLSVLVITLMNRYNMTYLLFIVTIIFSVVCAVSLNGNKQKASIIFLHIFMLLSVISYIVASIVIYGKNGFDYIRFGTLVFVANTILAIGEIVLFYIFPFREYINNKNAMLTNEKTDSNLENGDSLV